MAVLGASGCGKSSIARAGVVPRLATGGIARIGDFWLAAYMRPGTDPLGNLGEALVKLLDEPKESDRKQVAGLLRDVDGLAAFRRIFADRLALDPVMQRLTAEQQKRQRARINLLLVADQFEEIFNDANVGRRSTEDLVDLLTFIFRKGDTEVDDVAESRVFVLLTMRSEYVGNAATFLRMPDILNRASYLVRRLDGRELERVVDQPLISWVDPENEQTSRVTIDPELRRRLLDETVSLRDDPDHLPLLQHALGRLWWLANAKARASGGAVVLDDTLVHEALLGPAPYAWKSPTRAADTLLFKLLEAHAEQVYQSLDGHDRRIAELLFRELTDTEPAGRVVRRLVSAAAVADIAADEVTKADVVRIAMIFAGEEHDFIHMRTATDGAPQLEITHEALVRKWPRCNECAAAEAQSARELGTLTAAEQRWRENGQAPDNLLRGAQLDRALEWLRPGAAWVPNKTWAARYNGDCDAVKEFVEKSQTEANNSRQRQTLFRRLCYAVSALVPLLIVAGVVGWRYWSLTEDLTATTKDLTAKTAQLASLNHKLTAKTAELDAVNDLIRHTNDAYGPFAVASAHTKPLSGAPESLRVARLYEMAATLTKIEELADSDFSTLNGIISLVCFDNTIIVSDWHRGWRTSQPASCCSRHYGQ